MLRENIYLWRIKVWEETKAAAAQCGAPPSLKLTRASIKSAPQQGWATTVHVLDADCLEVAHDMRERGLRPVVLNLSDDWAAGGAIDLGSGAQEESLWRRTALCATQYQGFYPLCAAPGQPDLIYSAAVAVLRDTEAKGYPWLTEPWHMDFIACPAIKYPHWIKSEEEPAGDLKPADKEELACRLRFILDAAAALGNDAIVLGPMGCGAWKNPPRAVARIFQKVLAEYTGCFREIVVAALTTGGNPTVTNATIFRELLMPQA